MLEVARAVGASAEFWNNVDLGALRLPYCTQCERTIYYPRDFCPQCGDEIQEWHILSGLATVYSYSTIHTHPYAEFKRECPYTIGLVDLDEGGRMMTLLRGFDDGVDKIQARVRVKFHRWPSERILPLFEYMGDGDE